MASPSGFWKVTAKWNQPPYGWSETWYMTASAIATAITWARTYVSARNNLMPGTVVFLGVAVADVNNNNVSQLVSSSALGSGGGGRYPWPPTRPGSTVGDPTDAALRLYCISASQKHRVFMMPALPSEISNSNQYIPTATWATTIPALFAAITGTAGASTTIGQLKILDQTQVKYPLVSVVINVVDSRFLTVVTQGPVNALVGSVFVPVTAGQKVLIRRVQPSIEVNRVWLVSSVTPNLPAAGQYTYVLGPHKTLGQVNQNAVGVSTGYIRPVMYIGDNVVSVTDQEGIWNRRRGKLYGLPVGRRKVLYGI